MTRTLTLYKVVIKYKDKTISWEYGEPRGIEFLGSCIRISGVGIVAEYPYKGILEFHMTTKEEVININPRKIVRVFNIKENANNE